MGHLIKSKEGLPVFDDAEATAYVVEVSGASPDECLELFLDVWER